MVLTRLRRIKNGPDNIDHNIIRYHYRRIIDRPRCPLRACGRRSGRNGTGDRYRYRNHDARIRIGRTRPDKCGFHYARYYGRLSKGRISDLRDGGGKREPADDIGHTVQPDGHYTGISGRYSRRNVDDGHPGRRRKHPVLVRDRRTAGLGQGQVRPDHATGKTCMSQEAQKATAHPPSRSSARSSADCWAAWAAQCSIWHSWVAASSRSA